MSLRVLRLTVGCLAVSSVASLGAQGGRPYGVAGLPVEGHEVIGAVQVRGSEHFDMKRFQARLPEEGVLLRLGRPLDATSICRMRKTIRDQMSEKGFPVGRKVQWDRGVLPQLLALMREVEPKLEVRWEVRDAITFRVPGITRAWGRWRTKDPAGLECWFVGKRGQFNLSAVEGFGVSPQINGDREQLEGKIQVHYGYAKDQVRKEVDDWLGRM